MRRVFCCYSLSWLLFYALNICVIVIRGGKYMLPSPAIMLLSAIVPGAFFFLAGAAICSKRAQAGRINIPLAVLAILALTCLDQGIKALLLASDMPIVEPKEPADILAAYKLLAAENKVFTFHIIHNVFKLRFLLVVSIPGIALLTLLFNILRFLKLDIYRVSYIFIFLISGTLCSYIDSFVYNGSYDYVFLNCLGSFDVKDVYLGIALGSIYYMLSLMPKLSDKEILRLLREYFKHFFRKK